MNRSGPEEDGAMGGVSEDDGPDPVALFEAKAAAEVAAALEPGPGAYPESSGDPLACTLALKGELGSAELDGGAAFSGGDGTALRKALAALGLDPDSVFFTSSRPRGESAGEGPERLRRLIEAVDPLRVVATDRRAGRDLAEALRIAPPEPGKTATVNGRTILLVDGLEGSLDDETAKARVWRQFKALAE